MSDVRGRVRVELRYPFLDEGRYTGCVVAQFPAK
jgi:hypothetical protein